jgi:hypothetical protein
MESAMSRRSRARAPARAAKELSLIPSFDDTEPLDDDDHDGYQPIRERETIPMRDGLAPINPNEPWPFPTGNSGY